jgi:S-adenosylmethionine hydrolase
MLPITFLSDYGYQDEFVGVCHGVIEKVAPGAPVIDLAHGIPPRDVMAGALVLRNALPFVPKGVHLAVVDPGVGTPRRALAVRCRHGHQFVGPDNGLLWPAIEQAGGVDVAVDISNSPHRLDPLSATFHGRDLFAPVAARLCLETPLEQAGDAIASEDIERLELPSPRMDGGTIGAQVIAVDRFGNLRLNVSAGQMEEAGLSLGSPMRARVGRRLRRAKFGRTFADVLPGEAILYEDSSEAIAIALNGHSAADALAAAPGTEVELRPWSG